MARLLTLASLAHLAVSSAHPRACSANATGGPIDVWSAVDTWKHCHFIDVGDYIQYESWNVDTRPPAPPYDSSSSFSLVSSRVRIMTVASV